MFPCEQQHRNSGREGERVTHTFGLKTINPKDPEGDLISVMFPGRLTLGWHAR